MGKSSEKGEKIIANRKRPIQLHFCVTAEEKSLIRRKMILSHTRNMGAYLRKMAIDGFIVYTDLAGMKDLAKEVNKIGTNINQIAKRVNTTSSIYANDIQEIQKQIGEIWQLLRLYISKVP